MLVQTRKKLKSRKDSAKRIVAAAVVLREWKLAKAALPISDVAKEEVKPVRPEAHSLEAVVRLESKKDEPKKEKVSEPKKKASQTEYSGAEYRSTTGSLVYSDERADAIKKDAVGGTQGLAERGYANRGEVTSKQYDRDVQIREEYAAAAQSYVPPVQKEQKSLFASVESNNDAVTPSVPPVVEQMHVAPKQAQTIERKIETESVVPSFGYDLPDMAIMMKSTDLARSDLKAYQSGRLSAAASSQIDMIKKEIGYKGSCCDPIVEQRLAERKYDELTSGGR